jgi:hypothetical protein
MGQLLHASLEQLKLEMGIKGSLLSSSYAQYGILATPCWLTHTWKFLSEFQMKIADDSPTEFPI